MDTEFIAKSVCALTPITMLGVCFCVLSMQAYGLPNASYDVVGTHYGADIEAYSPLLPAINTAAKMVVGDLYPYWFILMELSLCFIIPYILLFWLTKQHRYGFFFIYGSVIPIANFITGTLPQAIIICLIILLFCKPKWFLPILLLAGLAHAYGLVFLIVTRLWMWYDARA